MLLWDIIRDWFVMYVFGGTASNGDAVGGMMGYGFLVKNNVSYEYDPVNTEHLGVVLNGFTDSYDPIFSGAGFSETPLVISVGDWLSTTATIITLVALCLFLFLAVKWVFNVFRNTLERVGK